MRAISTVLDVTVFVLLVSAGVVTLALAQPPADTETSADETAEVLASSTLSFEYELRGSRREAHGTVGTLLARGAVAGATIEGESLSVTGDDYGATVRAETRERLAAPNHTQIAVRWEPYRNAPVRGEMVVGPDPPDGVDVHTATVTVPAPIPDSQSAARRRAEAGYESVGRAVATAVAAGLLPSNRIDAAIYQESPTAIATSRRYRTVAGATGVTVDSLLAQGEIEAAHQRAVDGLTETFTEDMEQRFDSPDTAAAAVETGAVQITVRRWDR